MSLDSIPQSLIGHSGPGVPVALVDTGTPAPGVFRRVDVERIAPPSSNTGAQSTRAIEASVDYLAFTLPPEMPLDDALSLLGGQDGLEWTPTERGGNGYRQGLARGDERVFFDGSAEMGVFVQLRGRGCHQYGQQNRLETMNDWRGEVKRLLEQGAKVTRFDLAFDDKGDRGCLNMAEIRTAIGEGRVVSRFRTADPSGKVELATGNRVGDVIHFGSIMSEVSVCIYDKAKQMADETGLEAWESFHWVRSELRCKKERAHAMAEAFVAEGTRKAVEVLHGYLDFKEASSDTNRSRWQTCSWWSEFLAGCEKSRLVMQKVMRTVERVVGWLRAQVAPSLAVLVKAEHGAIDSLLEMVNDGACRLRPSHKVMLAAAGVTA